MYFLHGEEPYYIDKVSDFIEENALDEAEKSFNLTVLYGKDVDHIAVLDNARRYPMMAPRQVVIIKEAQEMKGLSELQSYFQQPAETTVLVFCHKYKKFDGNSKIGKLLKEKAVVLESKKLYDNQVPDWIKDYLRDKKLSIDPAGSALIAEYLGTDLSKISNELDKLAINLPQGGAVTTALIESSIGISKDFNVFELQRALGERDPLKANRIARYFAANPRQNPLVVVISSLYSYFSKVYMLHFLGNAPEKEMLSTLELRSAFFLKEYRQTARQYPLPKVEKVLSLLQQYDLKSKGVESVNDDDGALLTELVWKILHA